MTNTRLEEIQQMLEKHLQGSPRGVIELEEHLVFFQYTSPDMGPCYGLVDEASEIFFLVTRNSMHRVIDQVQQIEEGEQS